MYDVGNSCCTYTCSLRDFLNGCHCLSSRDISVRKPLHWLRLKQQLLPGEVPWFGYLRCKNPRCASNTFFSCTDISVLIQLKLVFYKCRTGNNAHCDKDTVCFQFPFFPVFTLRILRPVTSSCPRISWGMLSHTISIFSQAKTFS